MDYMGWDDDEELEECECWEYCGGGCCGGGSVDGGDWGW